MTYQRNVLASFDTRQQADLAAQRLMQAGLGDIQVRIVPPPSVAQPGDRVIVSAIVDDMQAHRAEQILAQYGHLDLAEESHRPAHLQAGHGQERQWRADRWRQQQPSRHWETQQWRRPQRMMENMPGGAMMAALTAVGAGLAFWYGMRQWSESEDRQRRGARNWSRMSTPVDRRSITDDPGAGRQRLREWREQGVMEGVEAEPGAMGGRARRAMVQDSPRKEDDWSSRGTMQTGIGSGSGITAGLGAGPTGSPTSGARRPERTGA